MNLLELESQCRLRTNDYVMPTEKLVGTLQVASMAAFSQLGGFNSPDLQSAFRETISTTISALRRYVVLPSDTAIDPVIYVDGTPAHLVPLGAGPMLANQTGFTPAATVNKRTVTIYPYGSFRTGTKPVIIIYYRSPRPLLYIGGFDVMLATGTSYGIKGKESLVCYKATFPDTRQTFAANELTGCTLSVYKDQVWREDYTIQEHDSGQVGNLWVESDSVVRQERPTLSFVGRTNSEAEQESGTKYLASIHRTSDLPEQYHGLVVELAVAMLNGSVPVPKEAKA